METKHTHGPSEEECLANAQLKEAALELLEACKAAKILSSPNVTRGECLEVWDRCSAAIAKARRQLVPA